MQIQFSEKELEDFLSNKKNLKKHLALEFIARQVKIEPIGIIDILAYSRDSNCFVIIELKRNSLNNEAFIQGYSYLKYFQEVKSLNHRTKRRRKFCLLLIGNHIDESIHKCVNHAPYDAYYNNNNIYYKLFNFDFNYGISFDFYSERQEVIESKIEEQITILEYEHANFLYKGKTTL